MPGDTEANIKEEEVIDYTVRSKERRVEERKRTRGIKYRGGLT